jgi:putative phosphoribosyl transferase
MTRVINFTDRNEAGKRLAEELNHYVDDNPLVLAISGGGVIIGEQISGYLKCDFDFIATRKVYTPDSPDMPAAVIAEDGSMSLNPWMKRSLSMYEVEGDIKRESDHLGKIARKWRGRRQIPEIRNRVVILTDDTIAAGTTMHAAIQYCRNNEAETIVVAAPVCSKMILDPLIYEVDDLVTLIITDSCESARSVYLESRVRKENKIEELMRGMKKRKQSLEVPE